jgi:hypothetical protein
MNRVSPAPPTIFSSLQPVGIVLLVLGRRVVAPFALPARQGNNGAHVVYLPVMRKHSSMGTL